MCTKTRIVVKVPQDKSNIRANCQFKRSKVRRLRSSRRTTFIMLKYYDGVEKAARWKFTHTHTHCLNTAAWPEFVLWGVHSWGSKDRNSRPEAESGGRVLGKGQWAPSPPARGLWKRCKLHQHSSGRSPDRKCIMDAFIAHKTRLVAANCV